jgi:hypothetical protein
MTFDTYKHNQWLQLNLVLDITHERAWCSYRDLVESP